MRCAFWGLFALTGVCEPDRRCCETWTVQCCTWDSPWGCPGQDSPREQPQLLGPHGAPPGKLPFPAWAKAQQMMWNGQEMVITVGHLGAWVSEKLWERNLGKAGSGGLSLVCKHAHPTLPRPDMLSRPWQTAGVTERLPGGLLTSPGCLPSAGVVELHASQTAHVLLARGLWAALASKPPGGLCCHPHSSMIPTSSCVHGMWHTPHGVLQRGVFWKCLS